MLPNNGQRRGLSIESGDARHGLLPAIFARKAQSNRGNKQHSNQLCPEKSHPANRVATHPYQVIG